MSKIALFHLSGLRFGGRATYTHYLAASLENMGHEPEIYEIKGKTEKTPRQFSTSFDYRNVTIAEAVRIARSTPSLITSLGKKFFEAGAEILKHGAAITIHKPEKISERLIGMLKGYKTSVITPSPVLYRLLVAQELPEVSLIPYPILATFGPAPGEKQAVFMNRIESGRGFLTAIAVNRLFRSSGMPCLIQIYGAENRIFTHKEIEPLIPEWRSLGMAGTFQPGAGPRTLGSAKIVLDIRDNDLSHTVTYPILEGWSTGATPIVDRQRYYSFESQETIDGLVALPDTVKEIAKVIIGADEYYLPPERRIKLLKDHLPFSVVPSYIEALHIE